MRIWIAEDSNTQWLVFRAVLVTACRKLGIKNLQLERFHDGVELLRKFERETPERLPALIFADIRMPGGDGLTALAQIRARFPAQRIVVFSSEFHSALRPRAEAWREFDAIVASTCRGVATPTRLLDACEFWGVPPAQAAMRLGAERYFEKPYNLHDVEEALSTEPILPPRP